MQLWGATSLLFCVISMLLLVSELNSFAFLLFSMALLSMGLSLALLVSEIAISGGALRVVLEEIEQNSR